MYRLAILSLTVITCSILSGCGSQPSFQSHWPSELASPWAGPEYWANPLQDWRIRDGRLENFQPGGDRNVFLLTRDVSDRAGDLEMSVTLGRLDDAPLDAGFVGFRVGINGVFDDYRDSAVRGYGINAGVTADGRLFIGRVESDAPTVSGLEELQLRLQAESGEIRLEAASGGETVSVSRGDIDAGLLTGGLALVSSSGEFVDTPMPAQEIREAGFESKPGTARGGSMLFWFRDWTVAGSRVDEHDDRAYGPIMFAMQTLDRQTLTLVAQMAPVGSGDVALEVDNNGEWGQVATAPIDPDARTAQFRLDWDDSRDTPYRLVYGEDTFEGTVRKDPVDEEDIVVAAFTGNNDLGFPHNDVVRNMRAHDPDFLAFTGDNVYERVGEYGVQRSPTDLAILDYLRKWYIFGWEYRDLLKEIPSVALPDDHDVYHGNIWGAGGRKAVGTGQPGQDSGGFTMPAQFVRAVHRTQMSNLPAPFDPEPIEQGIEVFYTDILYGGVSFAVIEDRKWKSPPKEMLPAAEIVNGWAQNPRYDASRDGDVDGAELLGERQLRFLEDWASDWSGGAWMKSVISQTIFNNVATLPKGENSDRITPTLRVMQPGEYVQGDEAVQDHDTNGWPQTGRNKAVRLMRQAQAFHIAGDQHLGSTIQYGLDDWNDASWAICVPSVANIWPRRWFPPTAGHNRKEGSPEYTGEFRDGFGNRMTVYAVSNPVANGVEPTAINHRAPGYGIIKFNRQTRKVDIANWPRWVDATAAGAQPYEGWPITIDQLDNGLSAAKWALDPIDANGQVVQVIRSPEDEVVYTLRPAAGKFTPKVWERGGYVVRLFDPDGDADQRSEPQQARRL